MAKEAARMLVGLYGLLWWRCHHFFPNITDWRRWIRAALVFPNWSTVTCLVMLCCLIGAPCLQMLVFKKGKKIKRRREIKLVPSLPIKPLPKQFWCFILSVREKGWKKVGLCGSVQFCLWYKGSWGKCQVGDLGMQKQVWNEATAFSYGHQDLVFRKHRKG